jgi:hypothetical protein
MHARFKRAGVGTNGMLKCKPLSKMRTAHCAARQDFTPDQAAVKGKTDEVL